MERTGGPAELWAWGTRVATWGAVAFAALVTVAALIDWRLPGDIGTDAAMPALIASVVFAGLVAGAQKRWTCVSAALAVFAIGSLVAGTDAAATTDLSTWSNVIEPAALMIG